VAEVPAPEPPALTPELVPEPELTAPLTIPGLPVTIRDLPEVSHGNNWLTLLMLFGGILVVIGVLVYLLRRFG